MSATTGLLSEAASGKVLPAGQMQLAKFAVPEVQGAKAQVSVSMFDNDTGGTLANVNRWRGQIGLGEITAAQLSEVRELVDSRHSRRRELEQGS